ncbi:MAG: FAD-dependent thymidylate synthase [Thermoproteota archaeon]|nr:MAG: FAD-dependent thymidylate synthase [Candidatus Korarchaeota archaeon]
MLESIEKVGSDAIIYLAARLSRSSKSLEGLMKELEDEDLVRRLIRNLFKSGHHSVFEHSFVRVYLNGDLSALKNMFFDFKYVELSAGKEIVASFNLRTALEMIQSENKLIRSLARESISNFPILASVLGIESNERLDLSVELGRRIERDGIRIFPAIQSDYPDERHAFYSFIVEGISRVCSHQFVRHRTLSFTQQSQRHVKPGDFYLPSELSESVIRLMTKEVSRSFDLYEKLVKMGVKKEDARYILPQAVTTRLFVSGRKIAWNHFLDLRLDPSAQAEIRKVAKMVSYFIRKRGVSFEE